MSGLFQAWAGGLGFSNCCLWLPIQRGFLLPGATGTMRVTLAGAPSVLGCPSPCFGTAASPSVPGSSGATRRASPGLVEGDASALTRHSLSTLGSGSGVSGPRCWAAGPAVASSAALPCQGLSALRTRAVGSRTEAWASSPRLLGRGLRAASLLRPPAGAAARNLNGLGEDG